MYHRVEYGDDLQIGKKGKGGGRRVARISTVLYVRTFLPSLDNLVTLNDM